MFRAPLLLAVSASLALAASETLAQAAGVHPNRSLFKRAELEIEVRFGDPATGSAPALARRVVASIGTEDGAEHTVFGDMVDVTMIDDSTIAILDPTVNQVRLFSTSGRHLQTFGRSGAGPGEFRSLAVIARTPEGSLVVGDAARRSLQFFAFTGRRYEYLRSVTIPVAVRSLCYVGTRLFASGASYDDGTSIRELDAAGNVIRAFGVIYQSGNALLNYQVAQGRLVCDSARQLIYLLAGQMAGEVRAYRLTGEEVWRVWVSDYATNRILELPQGGSQVERSAVGAHASAALTMTPQGELVAQWLFITREQMDARVAGTQVQSLVVDPGTGRARNLGTTLPLLKEMTSRYSLTYRTDPFPELQVRVLSP